MPEATLEPIGVGGAFDDLVYRVPWDDAKPRRSTTETVTSSLARGTDQLQGSGFALAGVIANTFGADEFAKAFMRGYTRNVAEAGLNPAEIGTFRNIEGAGDVFTYAVEGLFENVPNIGMSVVGGGIGAAAAKGVAGRAVAAKLAEREVGAEAAKRFTGAMLGRAAGTGAVAGGAVSNIGLEGGSIAGDIFERTGEFAPVETAVGALAAGAIETVADARWLKQAFGRAQAAKLEDTFNAKAGRVIGAGVKQSQVEGFTEMAQKVIEEASAWHAENEPEKPFWTQALRDGIVDSYLKSLTPGAVMGGGGQLMEEVRRKERVSALRATAQQNRDVGNVGTATVLEQQADEEEFKPATLEELKPATPKAATEFGASPTAPVADAARPASPAPTPAATPLSEPAVFKHRLDTAKQEILRDIASGTVPDSVRSFGDLADHVDANAYVNDAERQDRLIGPLGKQLGWNQEDYLNFTNRMIGDLDAWLGSRASKPISPPLEAEAPAIEAAPAPVVAPAVVPPPDEQAAIQRTLEADQAKDDFKSFLVEQGRTAEDYADTSGISTDLVPMPEAFAGKVKTGPSEIAGKGIFTTAAVAEGDVVAPAMIPQPDGIKRTEAGRYVNHADDANTSLVVQDGLAVLKAKRALAAGEELTVNYREQAAAVEGLRMQLKAAKPGTVKVGDKVFVQLRANLNKLHRAKVNQIMDDGTIRVYLTKDKTYITLPAGLVRESNAKVAQRAYHAQFAAMTPAQKKQVKADARAFDDLVVNEGWRFDWYDARHEQTATQQEGAVAGAAWKAGLERVARAIGEPDVDMTSATEKARLLPKLREYVDRNTPESDKQATAWHKETMHAETGDIAVHGEELQVGDVLTVDGVEARVKAKDEATGEVTLEDGTRFGTQKLDEAVGFTPPAEAGKAAPTLDAAISAIESLENKIGENTYSDPFLLTVIGKLALKITKELMKAGRTLEAAIREAIAQAKAQMPDEVVDEAKLATAIQDEMLGTKPEPVPQAATYKGKSKESTAMPALEPVLYRPTTNTEGEAQAADFIDRVHGGDLRAAFRAAMFPDPLSGLDDRMRIFIGGTIVKRAASQWRAGEAGMRELGDEAAKRLEQLLLSAAGQTLQAGRWAKDNVLSSGAIMEMLGRVNGKIDHDLKLKFKDVDSDKIRAWLIASGRKAVDDLARLMSKTNNVSSRVLRIVGREAKINWHDLFTSAEVNQKAVQQELFAKIRLHPKLQNLSEAEAVELTNILTEAWLKERRKVFLTEFKKEVALPNVKETDKAKLESALPELLKQLNLGLLANEAFRNAIAPKYGLKPITDAQAKALYDKAQEAQTKPEGWQRDEALRDVINEMAKMAGISKTDMLKSWWYASVLSGLGTQARNIVGNAGVLMENMAASIARNPRAAGALVSGMLRGMRENATQGEFRAVMQGRMAARPGIDIEGAANTLELLKESPHFWQRMISKGRFVTRFMLATDSFFYDANAEVAAINTIVSQNRGASWSNVEAQIFDQLNLSPEKRAAAEAKAKAEKLTDNDFKRRVIEILEQARPSEIIEAQHRFALEATMNNEPQGFLGHVATGLMAARKAFPPLTAVVPFIRISANVGNMLLQHSPAGLYWVLRNWRTEGQNWSEGKTGAWSGYAIGVKQDITPEEYQQLRAKVLLSHAAMMMTLAWAASGADDDDPWFQVTGSMQGINPDKRRQLEEQGIRPYSIKFGNRSFDYRLTPWAFALANVGQVMDGKRYDPKWDEHGAMVKFATAAAGGKSVIMDQSFLSNLMVLLERGPQLAKDQNANKYLAFLTRTTGGAIPTLIKEGDSWFEPEVRKAQPGWDYFQRELPFFRRNVGTQIVNALGEPVQRPRLPWSWLTSASSDDPVWQALGEKAAKGVFLPVPSSAATVLANVKRVKMTPEQFAKYQLEVGKLYKAKLTRDLSRFKSMTPEQAEAYFKREFEPLREQARMKVK